VRGREGIRRAALITLRRAILQNVPPGPERERRLEWLARAESSRQEALQALRLLKKRDSDIVMAIPELADDCHDAQAEMG
jgi:hypothetical protein